MKLGIKQLIFVMTISTILAFVHDVHLGITFVVCDISSGLWVYEEYKKIMNERRKNNVGKDS